MSSRCKTMFTGVLIAFLAFSFAFSAEASTQYPFNLTGFKWSQFTQPQQPLTPWLPWQPQPAPQQPQQPAPQQPAPQQPQPAPQQPQPQPEQPKQPDTTAPAPAGLTAEEKKMLDLVNAERTQRGLAPLKANLEVTKVARIKAQDMIDNNYFSHNSPVYGSPFDMLKRFGISYRTAGENLAGNPSVEDAHNKLMNSSGHRANILNGNFKEVGIGIVNGGPYGKMMVQLFIG